MKTVTGVIGPADLVERVLSIAKEFDELEAHGLAYTHETEAPDIVKKHASLMNVALFTGPVPFYASKSVDVRFPLLHISFSGSSVYKTLLEMAIKQKDLTRISMDTLEKRALEEIYNGLGLDFSNVKVREYHGPVTAEELTGFHLGCLESGATSALTCLRSTYVALHDMGLDVWRVIPDETAMREGLSRAVIEGRALRSREAELVITLIKIDNFDDVLRTSGSEYGVQRTKLELHKLLLDYAERMEASLQALGDDEFLIVSTRRTVEASTSYWTRSSLLEIIRNKMPLKVSIGMGLGPTAAAAHASARIALHYSHQRGGDVAHAVVNSRDIIGPIGAGQSLAYSLRTENTVYRSLAARTGLSVATIDRLLAFAGSRSFEPVTAAEMARALGVTARSGRRLISKLVASDLAEPVGEEQPYKRGRPRHIYRLKLQHFR
ncbi:MAG: GTP cyclohydrolase IIa [Bacillota bacterium]|jgi:GGDEF domain-containing protein/predicted transcriptional regulator|nr:GTP cyclohydrolase IIa [Bacillota bacterium]